MARGRQRRVDDARNRVDERFERVAAHVPPGRRNAFVAPAAPPRPGRHRQRRAEPVAVPPAEDADALFAHIGLLGKKQPDFDGDPVGAIKKYLSDDFIERYPDFAKDGFPNDKAAMLDFFEKRGWKKGEANKDTIYQVLADGDRVAVFHHVTMRPDDRGIAFVDIFRVKDGLIVEHWAVGQPVSDKVSPLHSMF